MFEQIFTLTNMEFSVAFYAGWLVYLSFAILIQEEKEAKKQKAAMAKADFLLRNGFLPENSYTEEHAPLVFYENSSDGFHICSACVEQELSPREQRDMGISEDEIEYPACDPRSKNHNLGGFYFKLG